MIMYTLTTSGVLRIGDTVIPMDDSKPEYQAYVAWLQQGNGPTYIDDGPVYETITVTAWQLIQALSQLGLLDAVENAANSSPHLLVRLGWQRAPNFRSDDPLVQALGQSLNINRDDLQNLFVLAASF